MTRIPAMDGLRGIAVLLILLFHAPGLRALIDHEYWRAVGRQFWIGVDIFFVLSGYLITRVLIESRDRQNYFRGFYWRRALRILPAYWTVLILTGIATWWLQPDLYQNYLGLLPRHLLFVQNWPVVVNGVFTDEWALAPLWSIAVEEQFYLVWPLLLWATPLHRLPVVALVLFFTAMLLKFALWAQGVPPLSIYVLTLARFDGFAAGAFVASLRPEWISNTSKMVRGLLMIVAPAFPLLAVLHPIKMEKDHLIMVGGSLYATVLTAAVLMLIRAGTLPNPVQRLLTTSPLTWLGFYSYGIYLLHVPVRAFLLAFSHESFGAIPEISEYAKVLAELVCLATTLVLAYTMFQCVEKPALRLRMLFSRADSPRTTALFRTAPGRIDN